MKTKLSITIDEDKTRFLDEVLKEGLFRNKSHIMEYSLNKFLENRK